MEKRDNNFGQKYVIGGEIGEIIKICMDMYIFMIRKKKENFFEKCLSVRLSVRPQILYTLQLCLKGVYWESKFRNFRPERTKTYEDKAE